MFAFDRCALLALLTCVVVAVSPVAVATAQEQACGGRAPTIVGTQGPDEIVGTEGDDVIAALGGPDDITGLGGNDVICAGTGGDVMNGGPGDDELIGLLETSHYLATDTVSYRDAPGPVDIDLAQGIATGDGIDRIEGVLGAVGSSHADSIRAASREVPYRPGLGSHVSNLEGGPGNDMIIGGEYSESLFGGDGDDILQDTEPATSCEPNTSCAPFLSGGEGHDRLLGHWLVGGPGDDHLEAAGGHVRFVPGEGDDTLVGTDGDRDIVDYSNVPHGIDADLSAGIIIAEGTDTVAGIDRLLGTSFADVVSGSDAGEHIWSADGDDSLSGGGGTDELYTGLGDDYAEGGEDRDYIGDSSDPLIRRGGTNEFVGGPGNDVILGWEEDDVLDGGTDSDTLVVDSGTADLSTGRVELPSGGVARFVNFENLNGYGHGTVLIGDDGPNHISTRGAKVFAAGGDDVISGHFGSEVIFAGAGADTVLSNWGDDVIRGGRGDDRIFSARGDDAVKAGSGNDEITAGDGDDSIDGGSGGDAGSGQGGKDTCRNIERRSSCRAR